jgi:membrane fusion protein, heavy metal efflux system
MNRHLLIAVGFCFFACIFLSGCGPRAGASETAPDLVLPPVVVEHVANEGMATVEHPDQFPLVVAGERIKAAELSVTGAVSPDVARNIPVISLASGRVVEIHARIGDTVTRGQLLMRVQSVDVSQAFSDYRQAVADEQLATSQFSRARLLYDKGAIAQKDLDIAENAEVKAKVTVTNAMERLRVLGADIAHPSSLIDIYAPVTGIVTEQNVTAAAGVKTLDNSPNLFTIADTSKVWIIFDVYENDLAQIQMGEYADIHLNAYPNRVLKGRITNIGTIMDPSIRTAKVRLEVDNPGMLRFGMFVTATFHSLNSQKRTTVPAAAILHLHDRDWVYVSVNDGKFKRVEVVAGEMLSPNMQEIISGIQPGEKVVAKALVLQNTTEQ